ncbi:MAG: DNA polymerase III subunit delta [Lysobacteraceae bacterium]
MALSDAQFARLLEHGELPPVVLIASAEPLRLLEAADAVRQRARALGYSERTVFDVDNRFDWNELAMAYASLSLFATRRLVELRLPTGKPGKEGSEAIIEACERASNDTLLLIQAGEWSRAHETAWFKTVEKAGAALVLWPMKPNELPRWIGQRLSARGLRADNEATQVLAERVEGNLLAAAQEVDKLALLHPGAKLDAATMQALVADSARYDVFGLVDAALGGDPARALRMLAGLRAEGAQVPALMGWIGPRVLLLARLSRIQASGGNLGAAMAEARIFQSQEAAFKRALARGKPANFERLLTLAARIDKIAKGRAPGDAWLETERLLVGIAAPGKLPTSDLAA